MAGTNEGVIYARGLLEGIEMLTDGRNAAKKFRLLRIWKDPVENKG